jgi:hypothetical protein
VLSVFLIPPRVPRILLSLRPEVTVTLTVPCLLRDKSLQGTSETQPVAHSWTMRASLVTRQTCLHLCLHKSKLSLGQLAGHCVSCSWFLEESHPGISDGKSSGSNHTITRRARVEDSTTHAKPQEGVQSDWEFTSWGVAPPPSFGLLCVEDRHQTFQWPWLAAQNVELNKLGLGSQRCHFPAVWLYITSLVPQLPPLLRGFSESTVFISP